MNSAPPTTSASLLASSRRLPARAAARHGARPAAPTIAAITVSTSGCAASSHSALGAARAPRCATPSARSRSAQRARLGRVGDRRIARPQARALREQLVEAALRGQRERPRSDRGWRAITSSVLTPTEPVAPRMQTRCIAALRRRRHVTAIDQRERDREHRQQRVDAIEDAAVAGQQRAAVLGAGAALDERLEQVADDAHRDQEDDDQRHADAAEAVRERSSRGSVPIDRRTRVDRPARRRRAAARRPCRSRRPPSSCRG